MEAIITGDLINSRQVEPSEWMPALKKVLKKYGKEPKNWEIFRGDSFQLNTKPEDALMAAFLIKAEIKQWKNLDVRIGIGLGEITYQAAKITESNGTAFLNSGECFEELKKQTLAIKTPDKDLNITLNLMIELASLTIDRWTETAAKLIKIKMENPSVNQKDLANLLNKTAQGTISEGLKRGGYDEIQKLLDYYKLKISEL
ncbi:transcriptional regulator [Lacihabitans sp. CCS-44]|uniref:SatD family protein n=1 Tax=Lacihabitans sp. CCS-44 TaxID=2487331 RepID=UPI0020CDB935|nr:SatD family protein [Lacihabitans sp. CCS-44]MCP9757114.1 transcriptional regulator [Lacihabitans sp. CCS-44]